MILNTSPIVELGAFFLSFLYVSLIGIYLLEVGEISLGMLSLIYYLHQVSELQYLPVSS